MNSLSKVRSRNILVDTNVVIKYSQEGFKERSEEFLDRLVANKNVLLVSQFTGLELLRNQDPGNLKNSYVKFLDGANNVPIGFPVILNAINLSEDYRNFLNRSNISTNDLIIGATATLRLKGKGQVEIPGKTLLLTENRKDFPEFLWKAVACHPIFADKEKTKVTEIFYLLEFNINYLQKVKKSSNSKVRIKKKR